MQLTWRGTDDADFPYSTVYEGKHLLLRVNDWPDEPYLYTMVVDGREVLELEEWPPAWRRPRV